ncbi:MAG: response regulator transcription factor [Oscillospiraceae bacterium]|nr:response regulator transcription factor [Oscillospiraceae bacterium]
MNSIFCVEDDEGIRDLITYAVKSAGFTVEGFESAAEFEKRLKSYMPSMVLLDIMLPDKDGIQILKDIRKNDATKNLPVILITAKGMESDKVKGFEHGADDYVTKPFGVMELISRIKAVLRRSNAAGADIIDYKGITLNNQSRSVKVDGEDVTITFKEFELLKYLMTHKGTVVPREVLLEKIWGYHFEGESRTLDVHIGSLRHKLGAKGKCIETIRNVGYKI